MVAFGVGSRVDGLYDGNQDDMWYPGRVQRVNAGEPPTFEVLYDDGEAEARVALHFLRRHVAGTLCVGTRVLGRYAGGDEWYSGKVAEMLDNGCYTLEYDDSEVEVDVPLEFIRELDEPAIEPADEEEEEQEQEGTRAETPPPEQRALEAEDDTEDTEAAADAQDDSEAGDPLDDTPQPADSTVHEARRDAHERDDDSDQEPQRRSPPSAFAPPAHYRDELERPRFQPKPKPSDGPMPPPQQQSSALSETDEYASIHESIELLERRLGDAAAIKAVLSTLVKQMRAFPQVTADLVHERGGEKLVIAVLKFHDGHAVIQCYCFVLLRRLCFLCAKSSHYFLRNGIVDLVTAAMRKFAEDAILQASACGALAVFTRVHAGLSLLLQHHVAELVLATIVYHKTYSIHTRQVHYYACEVLLELCELGDRATLNALCSDVIDVGPSDISPVSLLIFLLRQGLSFDDKKASCAVGTLLMCLAANNRYAAGLILRLNGLPELSTVMAKFPTEPGIQKYSASASKEIALSSVQKAPTKKVKETASEILQESGSLEDLHQERFHQANGNGAGVRGAGDARSRHQSTGNTGRSRTPGTSSKRKAPPAAVYSYPSPTRGATSGSVLSYKDPLSFSKFASPIGKAPYLPSNMTAFAAHPAPSMAATPQRSSLVILESGGPDAYTSERKQFVKEERQSLLFETYGVQGATARESSAMTHGIKRKQLKTHIVSAAESTWATPVASPKQLLRDEMLAGPSSYAPPHPGWADFRANAPVRSRGYESTECEDAPMGQEYYYHDQQPHRSEMSSPSRKQQPAAKRKKKRTTSFQVSVESSTQLRVSKEMHSPFAAPRSPTHKRSKSGVKGATAGGASRYSTMKSTMGGQRAPMQRSHLSDSSTSTGESLTAYAAKLFNDEFGFDTGDLSAHTADLQRTSIHPLTAREQAEIQERERLSFAEKLHKMIDKAKSTLAASNVSSDPVGSRSSRSTTSATRSARPKATTSSTSHLSSSKRATDTPPSATATATAAAEPPRPTAVARKTRVQSGGTPRKKTKEAAVGEISASSSPRGAVATTSQPKAALSQDTKRLVGSKPVVAVAKRSFASVPAAATPAAKATAASSVSDTPRSSKQPPKSVSKAKPAAPAPTKTNATDAASVPYATPVESSSVSREEATIEDIAAVECMEVATESSSAESVARAISIEASTTAQQLPAAAAASEPESVQRSDDVDSHEPPGDQQAGDDGTESSQRQPSDTDDSAPTLTLHESALEVLESGADAETDADVGTDRPTAEDNTGTAAAENTTEAPTAEPEITGGAAEPAVPLDSSHPPSSDPEPPEHASTEEASELATACSSSDPDDAAEHEEPQDAAVVVVDAPAQPEDAGTSSTDQVEDSPPADAAPADMYDDEYNDFDDDVAEDEATPENFDDPEDDQTERGVPLDDLLSLADKVGAGETEPSEVEENGSGAPSSTADPAGEQQSEHDEATVLRAIKSGDGLYADDSASEFASEPNSSRSVAALSGEESEGALEPVSASSEFTGSAAEPDAVASHESPGQAAESAVPEAPVSDTAETLDAAAEAVSDSSDGQLPIDPIEERSDAVALDEAPEVASARALDETFDPEASGFASGGDDGGACEDAAQLSVPVVESVESVESGSGEPSEGADRAEDVSESTAGRADEADAEQSQESAKTSGDLEGVVDPVVDDAGSASGSDAIPAPGESSDSSAAPAPDSEVVHDTEEDERPSDDFSAPEPSRESADATEVDVGGQPDAVIVDEQQLNECGVLADEAEPGSIDLDADTVSNEDKQDREAIRSSAVPSEGEAEVDPVEASDADSEREIAPDGLGSAPTGAEAVSVVESMEQDAIEADGEKPDDTYDNDFEYENEAEQEADKIADATDSVDPGATDSAGVDDEREPSSRVAPSRESMETEVAVSAETHPMDPTTDMCSFEGPVEAPVEVVIESRNVENAQDSPVRDVSGDATEADQTEWSLRSDVEQVCAISIEASTTAQQLPAAAAASEPESVQRSDDVDSHEPPGDQQAGDDGTESSQRQPSDTDDSAPTLTLHESALEVLESGADAETDADVGTDRPTAEDNTGTAAAENTTEAPTAEPEITGGAAEPAVPLDSSHPPSSDPEPPEHASTEEASELATACSSSDPDDAAEHEEPQDAAVVVVDAPAQPEDAGTSSTDQVEDSPPADAAPADMYDDEYNDFDDDVAEDEATPENFDDPEDDQTERGVPLDDLLSLADKVGAGETEPSEVEENGSGAPSSTADPAGEQQSEHDEATVLRAIKSGDGLYADDSASEFASEPNSSRSVAALSGEESEGALEPVSASSEFTGSAAEPDAVASHESPGQAAESAVPEAPVSDTAETLDAAAEAVSDSSDGQLPIDPIEERSDAVALDEAPEVASARALDETFDPEASGFASGGDDGGACEDAAQLSVPVVESVESVESGSGEPSEGADRAEDVSESTAGRADEADAEQSQESAKTSGDLEGVVDPVVDDAGSASGSDAIPAPGESSDSSAAPAPDSEVVHDTEEDERPSDDFSAPEPSRESADATEVDVGGQPDAVIVDEQQLNECGVLADEAEPGSIDLDADTVSNEDKQDREAIRSSAVPSEGEAEVDPVEASDADSEREIAPDGLGSAPTGAEAVSVVESMEQDAIEADGEKPAHGISSVDADAVGDEDTDYDDDEEFGDADTSSQTDEAAPEDPVVESDTTQPVEANENAAEVVLGDADDSIGQTEPTVEASPQDPAADSIGDAVDPSPSSFACDQLVVTTSVTPDTDDASRDEECDPGDTDNTLLVVEEDTPGLESGSAPGDTPTAEAQVGDVADDLAADSRSHFEASEVEAPASASEDVAASVLSSPVKTELVAAERDEKREQNEQGAVSDLAPIVDAVAESSGKELVDEAPHKTGDGAAENSATGTSEGASYELAEANTSEEEIPVAAPPQLSSENEAHQASSSENDAYNEFEDEADAPASPSPDVEAVQETGTDEVKSVSEEEGIVVSESELDAPAGSSEGTSGNASDDKKELVEANADAEEEPRDEEEADPAPQLIGVAEPNERSDRINDTTEQPALEAESSPEDGEVCAELAASTERNPDEGNPVKIKKDDVESPAPIASGNDDEPVSTDSSGSPDADVGTLAENEAENNSREFPNEPSAVEGDPAQPDSSSLVVDDGPAARAEADVSDEQQESTEDRVALSGEPLSDSLDEAAGDPPVDTVTKAEAEAEVEAEAEAEVTGEAEITAEAEAVKNGNAELKSKESASELATGDDERGEDTSGEQDEPASDTIDAPPGDSDTPSGDPEAEASGDAETGPENQSDEVPVEAAFAAETPPAAQPPEDAKEQNSTQRDEYDEFEAEVEGLASDAAGNTQVAQDTPASPESDGYDDFDPEVPDALDVQRASESPAAPTAFESGPASPASDVYDDFDGEGDESAPPAALPATAGASSSNPETSSADPVSAAAAATTATSPSDERENLEGDDYADEADERAPPSAASVPLSESGAVAPPVAATDAAPPSPDEPPAPDDDYADEGDDYNDFEDEQAAAEQPPSVAPSAAGSTDSTPREVEDDDVASDTPAPPAAASAPPEPLTPADAVDDDDEYAVEDEFEDDEKPVASATSAASSSAPAPAPDGDDDAENEYEADDYDDADFDE